MRLLVDLQGMQNQSRFRGIGRYVANLTRGLLRGQHGHELRFLLSSRYPDRIDPVIATFAGLADPEQFLVFDLPGPSAIMRVEDEWRSGAAHLLYDKLVRDLDPDALLIGSLFEGGADDTVITVGDDDRSHAVATILYDLIPLLNPDEHLGSAGARRWYFGKVAEARRADVLLGISHSACAEGIEHFPSDSDHVHFAGAAAGEEFASVDYRAYRDHPLAQQVKTYHGITRPYLMHTSALDPRKNFEGLVAAFARLPEALRRSHQLVLVCKLGQAGEPGLRRAIAEAGLGEDEVVLTGYVEDDELRILYANCDLFVFPSFHEGFGLPVLEAMWCGAPAVGSNVSSVPEVIGRADAEFDPSDRDAMTAVIARALGDTGFRADLIRHGERHARSFCWDDVAARAIASIEQAVARRPATAHRRITADQAIARIAALECWASPSDADLLDTARALARNEQLRWPRQAGRDWGISKQAVL